MKVIDKEGNVHEGESLTEQEFEQRQNIIELVHQKACGGSRHSDYDRKYSGLPKCEQIGNFLISKFILTAKTGTSMAAEIELAERENMPLAVECAPIPIPEVVSF